MSLTALSLYNGASTPVAKTFNVLYKDGMAVKYADISSGIVLGYPTVDTRVRPGTTKDSRKVVINISQPVLKEASSSQASGFVPAPEVQFYISAHLAFLIPVGAPRALVQDCLAYAKNSLDESAITDAILDGIVQS